MRAGGSFVVACGREERTDRDSVVQGSVVQGSAGQCSAVQCSAEQ